MDLENKTALVTGGARRVGQAITLAFAQAGANVVINHTSSDQEAEATAAQARAFGVEALPYRADIGKLEDVRAMVNAAVEKFGAVDILVNSAAPFLQTPLPTNDFTDWHRVTNIMINGTLYTANAVAPLMIRRGVGAIVNIVDLFAWEPRRNYAAHSVGKAGMLALTRQLAIDLAPTVRVNAVAPGPVLPPVDYSPKRIEQAAANTLLGHWGTPQDIADAVLFLARADYITAQVIAVDGGESYGRHK